MHRDYKYRFIAKMDIPRGKKGCITYLGSKRKNGYGQFDINRKSYLAHRVSYILFVGKIPHGLYVCHKCDNPKCVAPQHLFLGTHSENMKDMYQKKRHHSNKGENHGMAKLTQLQVNEIRKKLKNGFKPKKLSELYGVTSATIRDIKYKRSWK